MKIKQLSLFIENKPGHLDRICADLKKHNINVITLSLADTKDFGILRLIVADPSKAKAVLEEEGHIVNVTEVVAVEVPHKPGGLAKILDVMNGSGINIEYMYAFAGNASADKAALIFRFDDPDKAIAILDEAGISSVDNISIFE